MRQVTHEHLKIDNNNVEVVETFKSDRNVVNKKKMFCFVRLIIKYVNLIIL